MIKFKLERLQSIITIFGGWSSPKYTPVFSYTVLKMLRKLDEEAVIYNTALEGLRKEYCLLDDKGYPAPDENGLLQFEGNNKEIYLEKYSALLDTEVEIDCPKIKLSQLSVEGIKISPQELGLIEEFIEIDV